MPDPQITADYRKGTDAYNQSDLWIRFAQIRCGMDESLSDGWLDEWLRQG